MVVVPARDGVGIVGAAVVGAAPAAVLVVGAAQGTSQRATCRLDPGRPGGEREGCAGGRASGVRGARFAGVRRGRFRRSRGRGLAKSH